MSPWIGLERHVFFKRKSAPVESGPADGGPQSAVPLDSVKDATPNASAAMPAAAPGVAADLKASRPAATSPAGNAYRAAPACAATGEVDPAPAISALRAVEPPLPSPTRGVGALRGIDVATVDPATASDGAAPSDKRMETGDERLGCRTKRGRGVRASPND